MLTTETALPDLLRRLDDAGFDRRRPDLGLFWSVWKVWSDEAVQDMSADEDADMILFQTWLSLRPAEGYDGSPPHFGVNFTRQFSHHDEHGDYEGMEHLSVDFRYAPEPAFRDVVELRGESGSGATMWRGRDRAAWAAAVEANPSFRLALQHDPQAFTAVQGGV